MGQITLAANELKTALGRMKRLAGRVSGDARWTFLDGLLRIEWAGMGDDLSGTGGGHETVLVRRNYMKGLAAALPKTGTITIALIGNELKVGTLTLACELTNIGSRTVLPMFSKPIDVLLASLVYSDESLHAAGLARDVAEARERFAKTIDAAVKTMAWLEIPPAALAQAVQSLLGDIAQQRFLKLMT